MINPSNFKLYHGETLGAGARIVASNRLYINGWRLGLYIDFINRYFGKSAFKTERYRIALVYNSYTVPVGCAVAIRYGASRKWEVAFFIKERYRRKGYGSKLFKTLDISPQWKIELGEGVEGSQLFFKSLEETYPHRFIIQEPA